MSFLPSLDASTGTERDPALPADTGGISTHSLPRLRASSELRRSFFQLDAAFALQNLAFIMITFVQTTVQLYMALVEGLFFWVSAVLTAMFLAQLLLTLTACQATAVR